MAPKPSGRRHVDGSSGNPPVTSKKKKAESVWKRLRYDITCIDRGIDVIMSKYRVECCRVWGTSGTVEQSSRVLSIAKPPGSLASEEKAEITIRGTMIRAVAVSSRDAPEPLRNQIYDENIEQAILSCTCLFVTMIIFLEKRIEEKRAADWSRLSD